jgi:glutathione S-transferase
MLKVWGRANSLNVQKVLWVLGELKLPYEHIVVGGPFGKLNEPEYGKLNPHRRIPVVEDGNLAVWESQAILRYLAAKYSDGDLWRKDPTERAPIDGWMDWALTVFQPDFIAGIFMGYYRTPMAQRNPDAIGKAVAKVGDHIKLLDGVLAGKSFLTGDRFSLADIPAGSVLYRYYDLDIERPKAPNVEAWYRRLQERPAYRAHIMLDYSEFKERLVY